MYLFPLLSQDMIERDLKSFRGLHVNDKIIVRLIKSNREHISVKAQGIVAEDVKTEIINNMLRVYVSGNLFSRKKVIVNLEYKSIRYITAINGADITTVSTLQTDSLSIDLETGGIFYLDANIGYLESNVIEGSLLNAKGHADVHDVFVASSATVSAFDLQTDVANVRTSTGATAKVFVAKELHAYASLSGSILYKGNPDICVTESKSAGSITAYDE